jgi:diadenosine tetraphosphatase ApaH/serine/threonine PP2A family protein phosphatase
VLSDARARGADRIVSLGDVGGEACLAVLHQAEALAVFGNYEVSSWRRLSPGLRAWVRSWPPLLEGDSFLAVHAAPWWPDGLHRIDDFGDWLKKTKRSWRALFPYLSEDENHLWRALAELEDADKTVLFHGHTHQQAAWRWTEGSSLRRVGAKIVSLEMGYRYLVGVGSVGLPEDGGWAAYCVYDANSGEIELIRFNGHP